MFHYETDSLRNELTLRGHILTGLDITKKSIKKENNKKLTSKKKESFLGAFEEKSTVFFNSIPIPGNRILKHIVREVINCLHHRTLLKQEITKADFVIIGGGALLHEHYRSWSFPLSLFSTTILLKKYKKPYGYACCSVGQDFTKIGKRLMQAGLNGAEFCYVRDLESQRRLKRLFAIESKPVGDPALSIKKHYPLLRKTRKNRFLGINIVSYKQSHSKLGNDEIYRNYTTALSGLVSHILTPNQREQSFDGILLFSTGDHDDLKACYLMYDMIINANRNDLSKKISIVPQQSCLKGFIDEITQCAVVISTRLHAAIIPLSYGIPVISISHDSKIDGFFRFLNMEKFNLDIKDATATSLLVCLKEIEAQRAMLPDTLSSHEKRFQTMLQEIECAL